jgi:hypothetical protein
MPRQGIDHDRLAGTTGIREAIDAPRGVLAVATAFRQLPVALYTYSTPR